MKFAPFTLQLLFISIATAAVGGETEVDVVIDDPKRGLETCTDDSAFQYVHTNRKGKSTTFEEGCNYVAKKPKKRCRKKLEDGTKVRDHCPYTCDECDDSDSYSEDEFILEGNRMYVGCDGYVFSLNIKCGLFGDDDPNLCLWRGVFIGLAGEGGTADFDGIPFNPFPTYRKDIDDLNPDEVCIGSGVFSLERVKGNTIEPIPMISSEGCSITAVAPPDYMFVVKGEIASDGSGDINIAFSRDYGFTYYTEEFDEPYLYRATLDTAVDDDGRRLQMRIPFGGFPRCYKGKEETPSPTDYIKEETPSPTPLKKNKMPKSAFKVTKASTKQPRATKSPGTRQPRATKFPGTKFPGTRQPRVLRVPRNTAKKVLSKRALIESEEIKLPESDSMTNLDEVKVHL